MAGSVLDVKWTDEATKDLRTIFDYYLQNASHSVAQTIINRLQEKVEAYKEYYQQDNDKKTDSKEIKDGKR